MPPFWPRSQSDIQSRRAIISQDIGQWDSPLPSLPFKDTFFGGPGQTRSFDWPNPSFNNVSRARESVISQDLGQWDTPLPSLFGKDAFPPGNSTADTRLPPSQYVNRAKQAFIARQSADAGQWDSAIPVLLPVSTTFPPGIQAAEFLPRKPARAVDYAWIRSFPLELIGKDSSGGSQQYNLPPLVNTSRQSSIARDSQAQLQSGLALKNPTTPALPTGKGIVTELPPAKTQAGRDFTFVGWFSYTLSAVVTPGQSTTDLPTRKNPGLANYTWIQNTLPYNSTPDQFAVGGQVSVLPSRAVPSRNYEIGYRQSLLLNAQVAVQPPGVTVLDQQARVTPRSRDYSFVQSYFSGLIGQDVLPAGDQISGNTPPSQKRSVDYTFVASFPLELIGQDVLSSGEQVYDLPNRNAVRIPTNYEPGEAALALTQLNPCGDSWMILPPRGPLRINDFTYIDTYFLGLIGQDSLVTGEQLSGNTPPAPLRSRDYTWIQTPSLLLVQPIQPYGQQSFELPPRGAKRAVDYTWVQSFPLELIGQDQLNVGQSLYVLPPQATPRSRDYTWIQSIQIVEPPVGQSTELTALWPRKQARLNDYTWTQNLLPVLSGQDQFNPGQIIDQLPPKAAPRARDYSWVQVFSQLVAPPTPPPGQLSVDLSPRGAARSRDYTFNSSFPLELIGQDQFTSGEQTVDLPPRAPARSRDYTWTQSLSVQTTTPSLPAGQQLFDLAPSATPRSRDYTWVQVRAQEVIPLGRSTFDLAPRAPARSVDYTWLQSLNLSVYPFYPYGALTFELPPRAALRSRDYTWLQPLLLSVAPSGPVGQSTALTELSPRGPARSRDYTWNWSYTLGLIGADKLPVGDISVDLTVPASPRARDYTFIGRFSMDDLQNFGKPPNQNTTEYTKLPPYAAARAKDYTFNDRPFPIQQIVPFPFPNGVQFFEMPPKAPARALDYSWEASFGVQARGLHAGTQLYLPNAIVVRSSYGATPIGDNRTAKPKDPNR